MSLKRLFFALVVRPFLLLVTGFNVRHGERLPRSGPALVVANHNSHLDSVVLMSLFPAHLIDRVNSLTFTAPLFFHFLRYLHF